MSRLYVEPRKRRRRRQTPSDSNVMLHVLRDGGAAGIEELAGSETRSQMSGSHGPLLANISEAHGPSFVTSLVSNVRNVRPDISGRYFLSELQVNKIRLEVLFGPP